MPGFNKEKSADGFKKVEGRRQYKSESTTDKTHYKKTTYKTKPKEDEIKREFDPSKPFCKVCKDAGKTEEEYTNHFVRESAALDAPVVCPTLLSQACRYCRKDGHTVRYCPSLTGRFSSDRKFKGGKFLNKKVVSSDKQGVKSESVKSQSEVKSKQKEFASKNLFELLQDEDNESDNDEEMSSEDAKKQWDKLHSGKTLNYGDLKVKCVEGKLVFEVVNKNDTTKVSDTTTTTKQTWAQVASTK